jgi:hypothetical protein
VRPLGRNLKKELPEHLLYFFKKKKKKEEFARFRELVHVARLNLGRIAKTNSSVHLGQSSFNVN